MAVYLILSSVYICVTAVKHRLMGYIDSIIVCSTVMLTTVVYLIEGLTYFTKIFYIRSYATILFVFCNAVEHTIMLSM